MSTNKIDEMTEREAKELLNNICHTFRIGGRARTPGIILTNIENSSRRSACLSAVESHMTKVTVEDDEEVEDCPLRWGDEPDEYLERFKQAITNM